MKLYTPLYPPEGGAPGAFSCLCGRDYPESGQMYAEPICHAVTKTERGIRLHIIRKHGLREQIELPFGEKNDA